MACNRACDKLVYDMDWNGLSAMEGAKVWVQGLGQLCAHSCAL